MMKVIVMIMQADFLVVNRDLFVQIVQLIFLMVMMVQWDLLMVMMHWNLFVMMMNWNMYRVWNMNWFYDGHMDLFVDGYVFNNGHRFPYGNVANVMMMNVIRVDMVWHVNYDVFTGKYNWKIRYHIGWYKAMVYIGGCDGQVRN